MPLRLLLLVPRLEDGKSCESGAACASGFCVEGVCCDAACDGTCGSCKLPGALGTCRPLARGTARCDAFVCDGRGVDCPTFCIGYGPSDQCDPGKVCELGRCVVPEAGPTAAPEAGPGQPLRPPGRGRSGAPPPGPQAARVIAVISPAQ